MVTDLGMGFDKWHLFTLPTFQKELRPFSEIQKNFMKSKLGIKGSVCFNSTIYLSSCWEFWVNYPQEPLRSSQNVYKLC